MNQDSDPATVGEAISDSDSPIRHYYGDDVRRLFLGAAVGELAFLPFFQDLVPFLPVFVVIIIALGIVGLAGLTAPRNKLVAGLNVGIAAVLFFVFEYFAVTNYYTDNVFLTIARQALALVYLVAVYFGIKTVRNIEEGKVRV